MEVYRLKHHGERLLPLGISDGTELFGYRLTGWRENDMELLDCIGKIVAVRFSNNKGGLIKVLSSIELGWITKPTFSQVQNEFGNVRNKSGYNKYMSLPNAFTQQDLEGMKAALQSLCK